MNIKQYSRLIMTILIASFWLFMAFIMFFAPLDIFETEKWLSDWGTNGRFLIGACTFLFISKFIRKGMVLLK